MEYIDDMIVDGFFNSVECSLKFFLDNTGRIMKIEQHNTIKSPKETLLLIMCGS